MVIHVLLILSAGAISDKILNSGSSRFVARGVIAIAGFVVFSVSIFLSCPHRQLIYDDYLVITLFRWRWYFNGYELGAAQI